MCAVEDPSVEDNPNEIGRHVVPRRVFFPVCHDELTFCDYMFQDESARVIKSTCFILKV